MPESGFTFRLAVRPNASARSKQVFWNRAAREARRQKVLDDLIELSQEERRRRLDQAVAEGDIRAGEVDQALRLVARLEALSVMTIPGTRKAAASDGEASDGAAAVGLTDQAAADVPMSRVDTPPSGSVAGRQTSVRRAGRAIGNSPRRRRLRLAASARERAAARAATAIEVAATPEVAYAAAVTPEARGEEQWPDIAWLRPE
jgi:hypothetical protein